LKSIDDEVRPVETVVSFIRHSEEISGA